MAAWKGTLVPIWQIFPYLVAALQLCAAIVYCYYAEWRLAIVWAGVAVANLALAGIK